MKRETESLVKFQALQRALGLSRWQAKGLLQSIWDFAIVNCKDGGIGRFTNEEIALGIDYQGDADQLVSVLIDKRWIDENDTHRLVIHDWSTHCEDYVHVSIARSRTFFADGSTPKLTRVNKLEKPDLEKFYSVRKNARKRAPARARSCLAFTMPILTSPSGAESEADSAATPVDDPVFLIFEKRGGGTYELRESKVREYEATFGQVLDVRQQLKNLWQWNRDAGPKRKNAIPQFLVKNLNRKVEENRHLKPSNGVPKLSAKDRIIAYRRQHAGSTAEEAARAVCNERELAEWYEAQQRYRAAKARDRGEGEVTHVGEGM